MLSKNPNPNQPPRVTTNFSVEQGQPKRPPRKSFLSYAVELQSLKDNKFIVDDQKKSEEQ